MEKSEQKPEQKPEPKINPLESLMILDSATSLLQLNRADHIKIVEAVKNLEAYINKNEQKDLEDKS